MHGSDGVCTTSASGTLTETATYLRGRGVNLQFVVQGKGSTGFGLKRIGNTTAITTRVRVTRKIEGSVTGSLSGVFRIPLGNWRQFARGSACPIYRRRAVPRRTVIRRTGDSNVTQNQGGIYSPRRPPLSPCAWTSNRLQR